MVTPVANNISSSLAAFGIGFWHGQLSDDEELSDAYLPLLDADELARLSTLSNPLVRQRYIEVRGRLRMLLGEAVLQAPDQLRIARTDRGKPYLPDHPECVFNISHTTNQLAIAIASDCQLGVDIERYQPRSNLAALVKKCFAEEEAAYWHNLPEDQKTPEFYRFWTKKEAFVKATGRGIALGLKQCVVNPQQADSFLRLPEAYGTIADWRIIGLDETMLDVGLCGAVVLDRKSADIINL